MLNAITPLAPPRYRSITSTDAAPKALQIEQAPAINNVGSPAIEHLQPVALGDLNASDQACRVEDILTEFRGPSRQVQYPLSNEAIHTIKAQFLLVRQFEQALQDFSVDQLREVMRSLKQGLASSRHTLSPLPERPLCQLLAIAHRVFAQYFNFAPYPVQLLAVLGLLASKGEFKGSMAQIRTGEGKSTVIALLALILACQGKCIDVITSTEYLAKRDERKYKLFFDFFEITTSHICDTVLTPDHFSGQIIYGTTYNFEFSVLFDKLCLTAHRTLYHQRSHPRPFHVALVDEVDHMLLDQASHCARIAYPSQKNFTALYPLIYDYVSQNGQALKPPDRDIISACAKLAEPYKLSDTQLRKFIESAYQACFEYTLDEDYCLRKQNAQARHAGTLEVVIIDKDTGRLSENCRWQHGLHQFLEYKHGLPIQEETLTLGALSHPAFFAYYEEIYGVTGSLGAEIERNEITEMYDLTSFDVPTHQPPLTQQLTTILCNKAQAFNSTLLSEVLNTIKAARPCLILCRSLAMSHRLYQLIEPAVSDIRLLNDVQNEAEDFLVVNAGHSAAVTLATNAAGRGTDIAVSANAAKNGGLHVIFTFFPHSERVEIQGAGRAGRQGNPGSYRMILPHDDALLSKTGGDKMEDLIALRKQRVEEASFTRRQHAALHLAQHHLLESFCHDFQHQFSTALNPQAILSKWAAFYTDLENIEVNLEPDFDTALLNYRNQLNSLYDHFIKSLAT